MDAALKPRTRVKAGNAPLPIPEDAGVPVEQKVEAPYRIFVCFVVGKDKFHHTILNTPMEDIDTAEGLVAVERALMQMQHGKRITIVNWRALEG